MSTLYSAKTMITLVLPIAMLGILGCSDDSSSKSNKCKPDHLVCGDLCIDKMTDSNNCGGCGIVCDYDNNGEICIDGKCNNHCDGTICKIDGIPQCIDITNNPNHCGSCEKTCEPDGTCSESECMKTHSCNVDTEIPCIDDNNIIRCVSMYSDDTCGAKECEDKEKGTFCKCEQIERGIQCEGDLVCNNSGECACPEGLYPDAKNALQCNSPNDPEHCGANTEKPSGITCRTDQKCNGKECVCITGIECDGKCINPLNDHEHCGVGDECSELIACNGDEICNEGVCACKDSSKAKCGGSCIDVTNDIYCGAKGLCHSDALESPDFKGYNCKSIISSSKCVENNGLYSCTCDPGDVFDRISGDCVNASTNAHACGTNSDDLIDCKLYYGEDATCKQGVCKCKNLDWLKIDSSLEWYSGLSNKRFRCVNTMTDNRFCGATTNNRGKICEEGETCIEGVCKPTTECDQKLCSEHCYSFKQSHLKSCDGGCDEGYCSLENDYLIEGCQGSIGLTCNCDTGYVLVDYGEFKKCSSIEELREMHIVIKEGHTSQYVCEDGWSDNQQSKHHKDGSLLIIDKTVCNINVLIDNNNCGEVGKSCPANNDIHMTQPYCEERICKYSNCAEGYGDCNEDMQTDNTDGCETPITTETNCGDCGVTCGINRICSNGICCLDAGKIVNNAKSYACCSGLKKFYKCTWNMGILGCWNHEYQCASSQPDDWEEYKNE